MSNETKPSHAVPVTGGATTDRRVAADPCGSSDCAPGSTADVLNQTCYCVTFDVSQLRQSLHTEFGDVFFPAVWANHEHLFSASPVFVDQESLRRMAEVVTAVEEVARTPAFQDAVMGWAPEVARFDPGPLGGLLSYDFHLSAPGPRLIEINTNPGGAPSSMRCSDGFKVFAATRPKGSLQPLRA